MAFLVYLGDGIDTHVIEGKEQIGRDGKPIRRVYTRDPELTYKDVKVKKLWGVEFPHGERVEVKDPALLNKAIAMGCFEFEGDKSDLAMVRRSRQAPGKTGELKAKRMESLSARANADQTLPSMEPMIMAAEERKLIGDVPVRRGPGRPRKMA
jgi:hypothetical protein